MNEQKKPGLIFFGASCIMAKRSGEIPKRSKGPHSKCGSRAIPGQGFESLSLRHNSTLILIELGCCSFSQKPQYFWAFQRFKADPGSSRDRPFCVSIDFSAPRPKMGSLDYRRVRWILGAVRWIIGQFVGLLRGSLDYWVSSLDLQPAALRGRFFFISTF